MALPEFSKKKKKLPSDVAEDQPKRFKLKKGRRISQALPELPQKSCSQKSIETAKNIEKTTPSDRIPTSITPADSQV